MATAEYLTTPAAADELGVPHMTLYRWAKAGILRPHKGKGREAAWTPADMAQARTVARLVELGVRVEFLREATSDPDLDLAEWAWNVSDLWRRLATYLEGAE